jgi:hypothetical protein
MTQPQATGSSGALVRSSSSDISAGVFSGIAAFEAAQRMAQCLCSSTMVPPEYRGQQGLANSLIALEIAGRMGLSPLVVMQNMTPIHGRPSWSSSFLIATVNASGRFTPLRFQFDDEENPSWCYAEASDRATGETLKGEKVSVAMAKREGWWSRKDRNGNETSKWQSMTGQMLRYRAASFWVRVYCPEMSLGLMSQEEVLDTAAQGAVVEAVTVQEVAIAKGGTLHHAAVPQLIRSAAAAPVTAESAEHPDQQRPASSETSAPPKEASPVVATEVESKEATNNPEQGSPKPRRTTTRGRRASATPQDSPVVAPPSVQESMALPADAPLEAPGLDLPLVSSTQESSEQSITHEPATTSSGHQQAELATAPAPTKAPPSPAAAPSELDAADSPEPTAAEVISTGIREIPRITSLQALDGASARVNGLLASGRINEEGAERLWDVIDRRRQELQAAGAVEAATP